jgi:23S rRNA (adenine2030-N6)-methyltransferase
LNYRHAFHAGNFADVFKHCLLVQLLHALQRKDKPMAYLDTHAGIGLYDLSGDAARRTGEWRDGIRRVLAAEDPPQAVARYLDLVRAAGAPRWYPGSPALAHALLRPQDSAALCELHAEDATTLRAHYRADPRVAVHRRDGYEAIKALLPPRERRGLVLIDPPFEEREEFDRLLQALADAHRRWPTGVFALWYPVVHAAHVERFRQGIRNAGIERVLDVRFSPQQAELPGSFSGCGMVIVNPPWSMWNALPDWLPWLADTVAADGARGRSEAVWIAGE